ncbi:hypothetical protein BJX62DRAFT_111562 [Aspergillus germanicus]
MNSLSSSCAAIIIMTSGSILPPLTSRAMPRTRDKWVTYKERQMFMPFFDDSRVYPSLVQIACIYSIRLDSPSASD